MSEVTTNKPPSGKYLLGLLIDLLADQEGVKIIYELEGAENEAETD